MHTGQDWRVIADVAFYKRDMFGIGDVVDIKMKVKLAAIGTFDLRRCLALHDFLVLAAIPDQIGNLCDFKVVFLGKFNKFRQARHFARIAHDFANYARCIQSGKTRNINRCLGMTSPNKHPACPRTQRKHMTWCHDIMPSRVRINGNRHRTRTVRCRNPGGHTCFCLNRHGKGRFVTRAVMGTHHCKPQFVAPLVLKGQTDQPAPVGRHEVDGIRSCHLGGNDKITFVFAVFIIDQNKHPTIAGFFDDVFDRRKIIVWHL